MTHLYQLESKLTKLKLMLNFFFVRLMSHQEEVKILMNELCVSK